MTVRRALLLALLVPGVGCASAPPAAGPGSTPAEPRVVQPGAPGRPTRSVEAVAARPPSHTAADVEFMQGMIAHHAQALEMTALIEARTTKEDIRLLGLRIAVSQTDEIGMMQGWLRARGDHAPDVHEGHEHGTMMPGMLTADQMRQLTEASGAEFERLFLQFMIQHHEGALIMVDELYRHPGAGQEETMSAFTGEIVADQGIEIRRMREMLAAGR